MKLLCLPLHLALALEQLRSYSFQADVNEEVSFTATHDPVVLSGRSSTECSSDAVTENVSKVAIKITDKGPTKKGQKTNEKPKGNSADMMRPRLLCQLAIFGRCDWEVVVCQKPVHPEIAQYSKPFKDRCFLVPKHDARSWFSQFRSCMQQSVSTKSLVLELFPQTYIIQNFDKTNRFFLLLRFVPSFLGLTPGDFPVVAGQVTVNGQAEKISTKRWVRFWIKNSVVVWPNAADIFKLPDHFWSPEKACRLCRAWQPMNFAQRHLLPANLWPAAHACIGACQVIPRTMWCTTWGAARWWRLRPCRCAKLSRSAMEIEVKLQFYCLAPKNSKLLACCAIMLWLLAGTYVACFCFYFLFRQAPASADFISTSINLEVGQHFRCQHFDVKKSRQAISAPEIYTVLPSGTSVPSPSELLLSGQQAESQNGADESSNRSNHMIHFCWQKQQHSDPKIPAVRGFWRPTPVTPCFRSPSRWAMWCPWRSRAQEIAGRTSAIPTATSWWRRAN